jgi:hypothetical protein
MNTNSQVNCFVREPGNPAIPSVKDGRIAKVKALHPLTSTTPPSQMEVVEYSKNQALLRARRYLAVGTVVQVHLDGEFLLWKVFCCIATGNRYHVGIELMKELNNR